MKILITSLTLIFAFEIVKAESILSNFFKSESQRTLPASPVDAILFKKVEDANPILAMNSKELFVTGSAGVFSFDLKSGVRSNLMINSTEKSSDYYMVMADENGPYASVGSKIVLLSAQKPPKTIYTFSSNIRWTETNGNFSVLLTKAGEVAILSDGKVKIVANTNRGDLRIAGEYIELYEASDSKSSVRRYSDSGEVSKCAVNDKVFKLALSNDSRHAVGLKVKNEVIFVVGIECGSQKIVWQKKIHGEVMTRVQGIDNHFKTTVLSALGNCGENICVNTSDQRITIGGATESGVFCLEPKSGSLSWKFSHVVDNDPPNNLNTNIIAPMVCTKERLVAFQNGDSILYSQEFPSRVEKVIEYLSSSTRKILSEDVSSRYQVFTNTELLPIIRSGRMGFVTSNSNVVVLGK